MRRFRPLALLLTAAVAFSACDSDDLATVEVRVVSDLVPSREVATAEVSWREGDVTAPSTATPTSERALSLGEPLARGVWVATFSGVPRGVVTVTATLRRASGEILGRRPLTVALRGDATYTIHVTADCANVTCPSPGGSASFVACLAGVCVDPACSTEAPELCPEDLSVFCSTSEQCRASAACATAACVEGVCVQEPNDNACESGEYCSALTGCTPIPTTDGGIVMDAGADGGVLDDAFVVDATTEDAENADGFVAFDGDVPDDADVFADAETSGDGEIAIDGSETDDGASPDASVPCGAGFAGPHEPLCFDVDECAFGACDALTDCTNTEGGYLCTDCPSGTTGDGKTGCVDVNECDAAPCEIGERCVNGFGAYACVACAPGTTADGSASECADVNECALGTDLCTESEVCINVTGSYRCRGVDSVYTGGEFETHTCALFVEGAVKCWGGNSSGQLGTGDFVSRSVPPAEAIDFGDGRRATRLAVGGDFACAILDDGSVTCWGYGDSTNTVNGVGRDLATPRDSRIDLGEGRTAREIVAGGHHACVLFNDDTVGCWGANLYGQLGTGDRISRAAPEGPLVFSGGRTARALYAGRTHTCAKLSDDTLTCWGDGLLGGLGLGTTSDELVPPAAVVNLGLNRRVKTAAAGANFTCAVLDDDTVKCWGSNNYGQLGDGTRNGKTAPHATDTVSFGGGSARPISLVAGTWNVCARMSDVTYRCWGENLLGQLGYPADISVPLPGPAVDFGPARAGVSLSTKRHTCAVLDDRSVRCWGAAWHGALGYGDEKRRAPAASFVRLPDGLTATHVAAGSDITCVIADDGSLRCWGSNNYGQLGYGDTASRAAPEEEPIFLGAARSAEAVAVGMAHVCALLNDHSVKCWGSNNEGQLGYGDLVDRDAPDGSAVFLGASRTARQVTAGVYHTCALLDDDSIKCWGNGSTGQLGTGSTARLTSPPPAPVDLGGQTAKAVYAKGYTTCALLDDDSVKCWGQHSGSGGYANAPPALPVDLGPGRTAQSVHMLGSGACVLRDDSTVTCWGDNFGGELGYGDYEPRYFAPLGGLDFGAGAPPETLATGWSFVCALSGPRGARCWGYGEQGQLGYGDVTTRITPPEDELLFPFEGDLVALSAGSAHTCGLFSGGRVTCWGESPIALGDGYGVRWTPGDDALNLRGR